MQLERMKLHPLEFLWALVFIVILSSCSTFEEAPSTSEKAAELDIQSVIRASFLGRDNLGNYLPYSSFQDYSWGGDWDIIVPGHFGGTGYTDLLFYDRERGLARVYSTDGSGGIRLLKSYSNWRTTWDMIIPGQFSGDKHHDLLFYDKTHGDGEFYVNEGSGQFRKLRGHYNWRNSWDKIVPGNFKSDTFSYSTELFFYDRSAKNGEFYSVDSYGLISKFNSYNDSRQWDHVVAGSFGGGAHEDLLFVEQIPNQRNSHHEIVTNDGFGNLSFLRNPNLVADHNSKHFVPGDFDGDGFTDIMTVLNASFFANLLDGNGQIKDLRHLAQGGFSADIIVTGHFGGHPIFCQACYTSFVVYNQN